jgi:hypothetical protein
MIQSAFFQQITEQEYKRCAAPMESSAYERIQGIDVLVHGLSASRCEASGLNDRLTLQLGTKQCAII